MLENELDDILFLTKPQEEITNVLKTRMKNLKRVFLLLIFSMEFFYINLPLIKTVKHTKLLGVNLQDIRFNSPCKA